MEHIIPRSDGGAYTAENFVLAHRGCNFRRGSMSVLQYMVRRASMPVSLDIT
jgi:5-methylcytosine-specific restriction endonuclease McrA